MLIFNITADALLFSSDWSAEIKTVHRKAVNLIDNSGSLITLCDRSVMPGFGRITLPHSDLFDIFSEGSSVYFSRRSNKLTYAEFNLDKSCFRLWKQDLFSDLKTISIDSLISNSVLFAEKFMRFCRPREKILFSSLINFALNSDGKVIEKNCEGIQDSVYARLSDIWRDFFYCSFMKVEYDVLKNFIYASIGLGYGFTPSGDDLLSGFLCALHVLKKQSPELYPDCIPNNFFNLIELGAGNAPLISSKLLLRAAAGEYPSEISELFRLLVGEAFSSGLSPYVLTEDEIITYFLNHGYSSGREIVMGFTAGILFGCSYYKKITR